VAVVAHRGTVAGVAVVAHRGTVAGVAVVAHRGVMARVGVGHRIAVALVSVIALRLVPVCMRRPRIRRGPVRVRVVRMGVGQVPLLGPGRLGCAHGKVGAQVLVDQPDGAACTGTAVGGTMHHTAAAPTKMDR
jgi:hypothetical protein